MLTMIQKGQGLPREGFWLHRESPHHQHGAVLCKTVCWCRSGLLLRGCDTGVVIWRSLIGRLLREGIVLVARWWSVLWVMGGLQLRLLVAAKSVVVVEHKSYLLP